MHGAVVWASGRRWIGPSVGFDRDTEPAREIGLGVVRLAGRPARRGIGGCGCGPGKLRGSRRAEAGLVNRSRFRGDGRRLAAGRRSVGVRFVRSGAGADARAEREIGCAAALNSSGPNGRTGSLHRTKRAPKNCYVIPALRVANPALRRTISRAAR